MLDDPEAALAALAGDAPARSLVARGASGKSRDSGEDGYSDRSWTTSEGHHYEDDASETPSKTPEVTKLSVKTAPATGEPMSLGPAPDSVDSRRPSVRCAPCRRGGTAANRLRARWLPTPALRELERRSTLRRTGVNEVTFRGPTALPGLNGDAIPFDDDERLECEYSDPEPLDADDPEPKVAAAPHAAHRDPLQRAAQNYPLLLFVGAS